MKYAALVSLVFFTALTAMGADKKISELNYLGQASWSTLDLLPIVDVSGAETKNTKISDFDTRYFHKGTDVLGIVSGGTGLSSVPAAGSLLFSNGTSFSLVGSACTSGQSLTSNGSGVWSCTTPAVGTITQITVGTGMSGGGSSGSVSVGVNGELQGLSALSTTGYVRRTAPGTFSTSSIDLTADVTGTLPIANGGTGQTSAANAINALVPTQTGQSGKFLSTNGSVVSWATGGGGGGSVTDVTASAPLLSSGGATPDISIPVATSSVDGYLAATDWVIFNAKEPAQTKGSISTSTTGVTVGSGSNSTVGPNVTVNVQTASGSQPGLLSSTDWTTFNNKQSTLTLGNLTAAGTDGIAVTGGTGSVVGSGTSVAQHVADSTHNGYLSQSDWSTFNGKGSVSSVALTVPGILSVSGSPVTTTGTLAVSLATQSANTVFAGPASGGAATPTFRALVSSDIPFPLSVPGGSVGSPSIEFGASGIYSSSFGLLNFSTAGVERFRLENNGDVVVAPGGAGTLVVNGDANITGNISAANYPPAPPTGTANHIAWFDGSGDLGSSALTSSENDTIYVNPSNPTTGDFRGLTIDSNGTGPSGVSVLRLNNAMTSVNNIYGIDLVNSANSGDAIEMSRNFNSGDSTNSLTMQTVNNSGDFGTQLRMMEAVNSGAGAGGVMYNIANSGNMTNDFQMLGLSDQGTLTGNFQGINLSKQGAVTGAIGGINFNLDADATSNVNAITIAQNNAHTYGGSYTGISMYNNSGTTITSNMTGMVISDSSASDGKNGISINLGGTTSSNVSGISVNVSGVTGFTQQPVGVDINGGALQVQSPYDTATLTPAGAFGNNSLGGQFHIASGHPVSGAFGFGNNLGITLVAEDDMAADLFLGSDSLGFSVNGFVNQIAVASGKTVDTLNYMAAGGSFPAPSTGGTVTNLSMFRALGLLPGGGTLNIGKMYGFRADPTLCAASPTNCWGMWSGSTDADNYLAKNLIVGGTTGLPTNASVGVEIQGTTASLLLSRMTTTQKNALTAVNGMMVYDTTLDEFDCYAAGSWAACGGGGGGSGITALTGDVTASGTGSVAATLATVNSNVGTFGSASVIPSITVNAKGLVTAVATNAVDINAIVPTQTGNAGKVLTTNGTSVSWLSPAALSSNSFAISYTATSIVVAGGAAAAYDTMVFDNTGGAYNTLTGELTIPAGQDGFYSVGWTGTSVARQTRYALEVNGTLVATGLYTVGANAAAQGYASVYLSAGDVLKIVNETGITELMSGTATDNRLQVVRVGGGTVGNWATYTPSNTQGFGTITPKLIKWRQVGQNYEVEATIQTGTVSGSEAQFELPNGATSSSTLLSTSPAGAGTADVCGSMIRNAGTGAFDTTVLCEPGQTYVTFGISNGSAGGLTKVTASALVGSSETITIRFSVPIQGL